MLNTALRTSLRDYDSIVGYVFLDVCYVLQFYREELAEPISHNNPLIILDHPWSSLYIFVYFGLFWNHLETWHIICISFVYQGFISYQLICAALLPFAASCAFARKTGPRTSTPKRGGTQRRHNGKGEPQRGERKTQREMRNEKWWKM